LITDTGSAGHCLRRGDPFSHPLVLTLGSRREQLIQPLNRKGGRKHDTPPARSCRHRPYYPTGTPNDQGTWGKWPICNRNDSCASCHFPV